jgi:ATP-dependent Lon protease
MGYSKKELGDNGSGCSFSAVVVEDLRKQVDRIVQRADNTDAVLECLRSIHERLDAFEARMCLFQNDNVAHTKHNETFLNRVEAQLDKINNTADTMKNYFVKENYLDRLARAEDADESK